MKRKHARAEAADKVNTALRSGDSTDVLLAMRDIAFERGLARLSMEAGLHQGTLSRALSVEGNPKFSTLLDIIEALDLELLVRPRRRR